MNCKKAFVFICALTFFAGSVELEARPPRRRGQVGDKFDPTGGALDLLTKINELMPIYRDLPKELKGDVELVGKAQTKTGKVLAAAPLIEEAGDLVADLREFLEIIKKKLLPDNKTGEEVRKVLGEIVTYSDKIEKILEAIAKLIPEVVKPTSKEEELIKKDVEAELMADIR